MAAAKPMTKSQILDHLAKRTNTSKKQAGLFLNEFISLAYKEAKKNFTIPGLGKLVVVNRKKRMGRNPSTGETMVIPAKKVLKFRVAKQAKDAILPTNGKK
jgi:DNA-binding protein HU-beta